MNKYTKNIFRSMIHNLGSYIGASLIIALGVFIYVAMIDALQNLNGQLATYYQEANMGDIFATVTGIPESELERLEDIPGIDVAFGRLTVDVRLLSNKAQEIITIHLMGYDEKDKLNRIQINPSKVLDTDSLYLGSKMKETYGYQEGEPFQVLVRGEKIDFVIAGQCYSPDYVYAIPPGGVNMADEEIYDIACIDKKRLENLLGMSGQVNELVFQLQPGYTYENVRSQLIDELDRYGLTSISDQENQLSFRLVKDEMDSLAATGTVLPVIFMLISVFMLSIVLRKMIDRDRSLIGTLKAFGASNRELITCYLWQGLVVGFIGAMIGSIFAAPLGKMVFSMYIQFYNLPNTIYQSYVNTRISACMIALCTSIFAVYTGVKGVLKINPAESMRAAVPAVGKQLQIPKRMLSSLNVIQRMGVRSLSRSPGRTMVIVLAIAFPFGMLSTLLAFPKVSTKVVNDQFSKVQTYDILLSLDQERSLIKAQEAGQQLNGIVRSEAITSIGVELKNQNLIEFVVLYGLNRKSNLYRIMDSKGVFYEPPKDGIIINTNLAKKLHVSKGDILEVSHVFLTTEPVKIPISQVIEESLGEACYIDIESFSKYFNTTHFSNTILVKAKDNQINQVKNQILETSRVTFIVDRYRVLNSYKSMMENMITMTNIFSMLSLGAGIILIYNISLISIRERRTEFGTLLILGTTEREMWQLVIFEQIVYFVLGILMGLPMSILCRAVVQKLIITDTLRIKLTIQPSNYAVAFALCLVSVCFVSQGIMRVIKKIEATDILKER